LNKKKTAKIEDLKPSQWFIGKHAAFTKLLKEWQDKQKPFVAKKKAAEKKKKETAEEEVEGGEEAKAEDLDIFGVEDVCDACNGEPLFVDFVFEDWALFTLRYELFLLTHAFKHDVDDDQNPGIHETNLAYYYTKYFNKQFLPKHFGKESVKELMDFVKDSVKLDADNSVLATDLDTDVDTIDIFVKLTEECRRERQRRLDAGDETARIKFNAILTQVTKPAQPVKAVGVGIKTVGAAGAVGVGPRPGQWRPQTAFGAAAMGKGKW